MLGLDGSLGTFVRFDAAVRGALHCAHASACLKQSPAPSLTITWITASSRVEPDASRAGLAEKACRRDRLCHCCAAARTFLRELLQLPPATMMTGQLSRGLVALAGRVASNNMLLRPLSATASGGSGASKSPRGARPLPPQPLKFVDSEDANPDDPEEALFSPENTEGMTSLEIARMRVVYGFVKEHADVVEKKLAPLDPASNPLIDQRSVRI